jgi:ribosomal protein L21E
MTGIRLAKGRWRALTKSTETTPTEFQVGDIVTFDEKFMNGRPNKYWQGGKGEIVGFDSAKNPNYPFEVRLIENPPLNDRFHGETVYVEAKSLALLEQPSEDVVNHPKHYTQYPVEVIELTRHMPFCDGNVVKYVARSPFKGNRLQDLNKALWYLKDAIAEEEKKLENAK